MIATIRAQEEFTNARKKLQDDHDQWESQARQWAARCEYAESELVKLSKPVPKLTYSSTQETSCAWCNKRKHTPLRRDEMGGYVCLTCIDNRLDRLTKALETVCHCDDKAIVGEDSEREIVKRLAVAIDAAENGLAYPGDTQIEMSADRCAKLADMEGDESPSACGPELLAGLSPQNVDVMPAAQLR